MSDVTRQQERNFTSALIQAVASLDNVLTHEEVRVKANQFAEIMGYRGNIETVVEDALIAIDTRMGVGVSLIDFDAQHDEDWTEKREVEIEWKYSDSYQQHLRNTEWHPAVVQSLNDVTSKILGQLQDPTSEGSWDRRGLVIGHVQSGKTANYLGLVTKAADSGYKFIIIIAGMHNNLRKQTQERVDEGFIGRSSDPEKREMKIGVGNLEPDYPHPVTITTVNDDFTIHTARKFPAINDFSKPVVLVIKKNVRTLDAVFKWLRDLHAKQGMRMRISDIPLLMIDDEADNASINTNKEDLDPTRTNKMLRRILGLFDKSCYVGYTATPFANIFINPDHYEEDVREELFPRDFIYSLDAPNIYFGPDKVFIEEDSSAKHLREILDAEEYIPLTHRKDDDLHELPPSLYQAINVFLLARTIRNLRGHSKKHCSMMINVSRFVLKQIAVRDLVSLYISNIGKDIKANYALTQKLIPTTSIFNELKKCFEGEFQGSGVTWEQIKSEINTTAQQVRIFTINSKSDEVLDYKKYENSDAGLTCIAVGGLSLSRGLTIEGLTVSYMYRNTRMYDTLMQMGRWFGYRQGFEDLCRIFLSVDSMNWYAHIAEASEELRSQIARMRRDKLSPRQFGLYVKAHPDRLLITAPNKMRTGRRVTYNQNFSGQLRETYLLPAKPAMNAENEDLIETFWQNKFDGGNLVSTSKGWAINDVDTNVIQDFLGRFQAHPSFGERKSALIEYLQAISEKNPLSDVVLISIGANGEDADDYKLGAQVRNPKLIETAWRLSRDRVASRGDEKLGLTPEQVNSANSAATDKGKTTTSDLYYRIERQKPLLMLHILQFGDNPEYARVPAFGLSLPPGDYVTEVEVVANTVWIDLVHNTDTDDPDEEEDYDD